MARRLLIAVLTTMLLLSAAAPASAGGHRKLQYWAGHTSQSQRIDIGLERTHHGLRFIGFDVRIQLTCEDTSVQDWVVGSHLSPGEHLVNKQLEYYENYGDMAIAIAGDFSQDRATGNDPYHHRPAHVRRAGATVHDRRPVLGGAPPSPAL